MKAKRKRIKPRDPNHKALENPLYRQRIVPVKPKPKREGPSDKEDWGE